MTIAKMIRRLSVVIVLVILEHSFSANAVSNKERKCPSDITKLAHTSSLRAQCKQNKPKTCCSLYGKYRAIDGVCNHILTDSGSTGSVLDKLLHPTYDDERDAPRKLGVGGEPLPSPREVSVNILTDKTDSSSYTLLLLQYGQWIAHDIISTTTSQGGNCCGPNGTCPPIVQPTNCFPFEVASNDPSFPGICVSFVRSAAANCSNRCDIGFRINTNDVTTYIDNSQMYGSSSEVEESVREKGTPFLRTSHGDFPPESKNATCNKPNVTRDYCFLAGDARSNQHSLLSAFHTFWLRVHNFIARELCKLNPRLPYEKVYQNTKQLVNGIHQSIIYNEYLPIILGADGVRRWKLSSMSGRSVYNPDGIPRIIQEATAAALRFGHSQILGEIPVGNQTIPLSDLFNNPGIVLEHYEDFIAALIGRSQASNLGSQVVNRFFTKQVTQKLFLNKKTGRGGDLPSTNIQRGRDNGLATYAQVREFFCLPPITGFNDTKALGPDGYKLQNIYKSVEDIDLYVGGIMEEPESGLLGPTFNFLAGLQYFILKYFDRFFFDNNQRHFTDHQLAAIRAVTMAKLVCHLTNFTVVQENVFKNPSPTNKDVSCARLKENGLNLNLFAELDQSLLHIDLL